MQLLTKDYPYAEDGLLVWTALEKMVSDYVVRVPSLLSRPGLSLPSTLGSPECGSIRVEFAVSLRHVHNPESGCPGQPS